MYCGARVSKFCRLLGDSPYAARERVHRPISSYAVRSTLAQGVFLPSPEYLFLMARQRPRNMFTYKRRRVVDASLECGLNLAAARRIAQTDRQVA